MLERSTHLYIWRWVDWNAEGAGWGNNECGALDASPRVTEETEASGKQCTQPWALAALKPGQQWVLQLCPPTRGDPGSGRGAWDISSTPHTLGQQCLQPRQPETLWRLPAPWCPWGWCQRPRKHSLWQQEHWQCLWQRWWWVESTHSQK